MDLWSNHSTSKPGSPITPFTSQIQKGSCKDTHLKILQCLHTVAKTWNNLQILFRRKPSHVSSGFLPTHIILEPLPFPFHSALTKLASALTFSSLLFWNHALCPEYSFVWYWKASSFLSNPNTAKCLQTFPSIQFHVSLKPKFSHTRSHLYCYDSF